MTLTSNSEFFDEFWNDVEPHRYAEIESHFVRIIEEIPSAVYASVHNISITDTSKNIMLLASELPRGWKAAAGRSLKIDDETYLIHQDAPVQSASTDGVIIRFTVHKA